MIELSATTLPRIELQDLDGYFPPVEGSLDFRTFSSLRRMVGHQHNRAQIGRADFIKQVTLYLPEVAARIEESDFGIVHLEVGAMKLATQQAIERGDFVTVRSHLFLIVDLFDRADNGLHDAIRVSYLEALFLGESSARYHEARSLLSRPMENVLRQAELRWKKQRCAGN